jgi:hypothetical protein
MAVGIKSPQRMPYDEAVLYCMTSNENGYKDWRLPFEHETGNFTTLLIWCDDDIYKDTENEFFAIPVRTIDA